MSEDLTKLTLLLMGEAVATKSLMAALIASHPDPVALSAMWNGSKAQWIEEEERSYRFQDETYRHGLLSALGWMTQSIDRSAGGG